jgi:hypothetical protein
MAWLRWNTGKGKERHKNGMAAAEDRQGNGYGQNNSKTQVAIRTGLCLHTYARVGGMAAVEHLQSQADIKKASARALKPANYNLIIDDSTLGQHWGNGNFFHIFYQSNILSLPSISRTFLMC